MNVMVLDQLFSFKYAFLQTKQAFKFYPYFLTFSKYCPYGCVMIQNKDKIQSNLFSKSALFTICIFYIIVFIFELFQPIFIKLGMNVKVKEIYFIKQIQLGSILNFKMVSILTFLSKLVRKRQTIKIKIFLRFFAVFPPVLLTIFNGPVKNFKSDQIDFFLE